MYLEMDSDSVVRIANRYGLDTLGIKSQLGARSYATTLVLVPTQPPVRWLLGLFRWYSGWGVTLTDHTPLAPKLKTEKSYMSLPPLALHALF
jgi:hypothetical protein